MTLLSSGRPIATIFDLVGDKENDMTASLAYVLAHSQCFLQAFVSCVTGKPCKSVDDAELRIQTSRRGEGITDIEIDLGKRFFAIIEAKRGVVIPSHSQLSLYAPIVKNHCASEAFLITISSATQEFARTKLTSKKIRGIRVVHRSWRNLKDMAEASRGTETYVNRRLLDQFANYLGGLLGLENKYSNMVYVVSLAHGNPKGWSLSWIDIVEKRRRYFYPVGAGWPDPPNYMGFRYDGKLQAICHVESFSIFDNPQLEFAEAADEEWGAHYCLILGDPIIPSRDVRNGERIRRANKCWCMLDTLLTAQTISDALTKTEERCNEE